MRADTSLMVADNPSNIIISRKTSTITAGKKSSDTAPLVSQTVRLYLKNKTERAREGDDFRFVRVRQVRMLCEYNADVLAHSDTNEDTFTPGAEVVEVKVETGGNADTLDFLKSGERKTYRITDVREIKWEGVVVSKQCTLEEMS